jgi:uncharacterized protein
MLIRLSVENWMSFRDRISFSMIASRERQHGERVPMIDKYQTRVLPIAAIYGGNASGKTNLFKAISFVEKLVVKGTQPDSLISTEPFSLDSYCEEQPTFFSFELLIDETIYEFSFSVTKQAVLEEKLVQIASNSERILYHRKNNKPNFDKSLKNKEFLKFAFEGTRDNQLFLTNSVSQKVEDFKPVYNWFKNSLELIAPDARFGPFGQFLDEGHHLYSKMKTLLPKLDTGIIHLGGEETSIENVPLLKMLKSSIQEDIKVGKTLQILGPGEESYLITKENGDLKVKKLVTYHAKSDGTEAKFDMKQESDGTRRVINLIPAFLGISAANSKKVFIIDELDRSLHTLLTRQLLEIYLDNCSKNSRSQLLFTTHDVLLMDQKLLRRDEMWVTERDVNGLSNIFSFSEYKDVRYDKDIRKSYLQGRMGGIPRFLLGDVLANPNRNEESGGND